jgi:hypothetical protein
MPLTLAPPPLSREDALTRRLHQVAGRLRRTIVLRAGARLVLVTVLLVVVLGFLDHRYQLPSLVRAFGLTAILVGWPLYIRNRIRKPLRGSDDLVQIALRIERAYPEFNDSLVSAVQFLDQENDDRTTSPGLRRAAVRRATRKAERYEFDKAVDSRWTKRSIALAMAAVAGAAALGFSAPVESRVALMRIAMPFGGVAAPTKTTLTLVSPEAFPHRMARGEPLDVRVSLRGVIPDRVTLSVRLDGAGPSDQSFAVEADEASPNAADLTLRIEPTRIPKDFEFRVRANDAESGWKAVQVFPPPVLVPLDGRPSPQLHLTFPAYTDLPAADLPDGSGVIDCVAGTRVTLRAATDRPVTRAYLAFRPDNPRLLVVPALAPFGADTPVAAAGLDLLAREAWAEVPVAIGRSGTLLEAEFVPRLPGPHALRFEDDTGLGTTRMFDVRVQPDPAPMITLERPAVGRDSLLVLPDAEVTVQARVLDKMFAVRSVRLEHRLNHGPVRSIPWYNGDLAGRLLPAIGTFMRGVVPMPSEEPLRLRPQALAFENRLSVARFRHADGSALKEGDVITLQVAADDFDDVTGFKPSGRSHEVTLVIGTRADLEAIEQQAQSDIRDELARLHALQREARTKVQEAAAQAKATGRLRPEDQDKLGQAEQSQQQIRSRINNPEDGIRAHLDKLKQAAKDNHMPRSPTTDRLDGAAAELKRLAEEELEPLEADLAAARRTEPNQTPTAPLGRAEKRQKDVEQTLRALLDQLEPWSGAGAIRGEARGVLNELKRQIEKGERAAVPPDTPPDKLTPEQKAELERAGVNNDRVAERGRDFIEKMNRLAVEKDAAVQKKLDHAKDKELQAALARERASQAPKGSEENRRLTREADDLAAEAKQSREAAEDLKREADALRDAATAGNTEQLKEQLRQAGQLTRQNQASRAAAEQKAAAGNLERLLNSLDEQKEQDADRMAKKNRDAEQDLNKLIEDQERLQKKIEDAQKLTDPQQRHEELAKLGRDQEKLEAEARDLAQRLSRNQAEPAAQELRRASREMAQAREALENGEAPVEKLDDALDRLDEAKRELDQARQQNEEELQREQAAKFADEIKVLRDRQQRAIEEAARLHAIVKRDKKWERPVRTSLNDLRQQQQTIAGDVRALLEKKFQDAAVFGRMLKQSADAMDLAAKRIDSRLDAAETGPFDLELEDIADAGIQSQQKLALKRLDQLLEALKPEKPQQQNQPPMGGMPPEGPMPMGMKPGEQLPPLAQLKALRELQTDIAERTAAFDKAHPDRTKLNDDEAAELEALEQMQRDVADLIKQLSAMPMPDL